MEKNRSELILDTRLMRVRKERHPRLNKHDGTGSHAVGIQTVFFLIKKSLIILITFYQLIISSVMRPCCRFYPTCSQYTLEAIQIHSLHKALFLSIRRILRCHPWHPGGIDLVPPKIEKNHDI